MKSPIIFYQYFSTTDLEYFRNRIAQRFKETGHDREIIFRTWVCDDEVPLKDGDIYCYDTMALSFLVENDYIRQVPDIIDTSRVFPWIMDTTKFRKKNYGFPWMVCFDAVITRKKDYKPVYTDDDLRGQIAIPMGTFLTLWYFQAVASAQCCGNESSDSFYREKAVELLDRLVELTGDRKIAMASHYLDFDGKQQFIDGKKKYIAHFTELVHSLPADEYAINHINFSRNKKDDFNFFYVDFVSMGKNVTEEKLLDCLDLMEIICSRDFQKDICMPGGNLSYMCPADSTIYSEFGKIDKLYNQLYDIVSDENNCAFRFQSDFYEKVPKMDKILREVFNYKK